MAVYVCIYVCTHLCTYVQYVSYSISPETAQYTNELTLVAVCGAWAVVMWSTVVYCTRGNMFERLYTYNRTAYNII